MALPMNGHILPGQGAKDPRPPFRPLYYLFIESCQTHAWGQEFGPLLLGRLHSVTNEFGSKVVQIKKKKKPKKENVLWLMSKFLQTGPKDSTRL